MGLFGSQPTMPSSMCLMDGFRRGSASVAVPHQAFICVNFPSLSKTGNKTGDINDLDCQEQAVPLKCKHFLLCLSFYVFQSHMFILFVSVIKFGSAKSKLQVSNALLIFFFCNIMFVFFLFRLNIIRNGNLSIWKFDTAAFSCMKSELYKHGRLTNKGFKSEVFKI